MPDIRLLPSALRGTLDEWSRTRWEDLRFTDARGAIQGIRVPNNGQVVLFWASGATLPGITQVLIGDPIGNTGTFAPATTEQVTLPASNSGWLGPWSPATYNIQQVRNTWSGAINTQVAVAADVGCVLIDFTTITTLVVRAFTLVPVQP